MESVLIIEYLITSLKPNIPTTREKLEEGKLNRLKDVEPTKQMPELAKVTNLTEEYLGNVILNDATDRFKDQIDFKIDSYMKQFKGVQRKSWLNKINEVNEEKNIYKKLAKQALKSIMINRYEKAFYNVLNRKW